MLPSTAPKREERTSDGNTEGQHVRQFERTCAIHTNLVWLGRKSFNLSTFCVYLRGFRIPFSVQGERVDLFRVSWAEAHHKCEGPEHVYWSHEIGSYPPRPFTFRLDLRVQCFQGRSCTLSFERYCSSRIEVRFTNETKG